MVGAQLRLDHNGLWVPSSDVWTPYTILESWVRRDAPVPSSLPSLTPDSLTFSQIVEQQRTCCLGKPVRKLFTECFQFSVLYPPPCDRVLSFQRQATLISLPHQNERYKDRCGDFLYLLFDTLTGPHPSFWQNLCSLCSLTLSPAELFNDPPLGWGQHLSLITYYRSSSNVPAPAIIIITVISFIIFLLFPSAYCPFCRLPKI